MKMPEPSIRRFLCALCALACFFSTGLCSVAYAEGPEGSAPSETLTVEQAQEMQAADEAVTSLTESDAYAAMSRDERQAAALAELEELVDQGLVQRGSVYSDDDSSMVSFAYSCGALGGILLEEPEDENEELFALPLGELPASLDEENDYDILGEAVIYYAFDNTINSNRYPYYAYMQAFWTSIGMPTRIDTNVTVSDLRRMDQYDLCLISAHGAYYTYTYGLFWKRLRTEPLIILAEKSTPQKDLFYGFDLLLHRIIKVNGMYCVTPDFFRGTYWRGQLRDTIVLSETCEFYGVDGSVDSSMADALLAGGARAVVGFVNNVYAIYSRSMMWDIINQLIMGQTVQDAVQHAMETYGTDDLVWYRAQGGKRPHAAAAYPLLRGDENAVLYDWELFWQEYAAAA